MPHIMSDKEYRAMRAANDYLNDPAPLPLPLDDDDDDYDTRKTCGLIEDDEYYPEAAAEDQWNK